MTTTHLVEQRLTLHVSTAATVDGRAVERTVRTHSATLWFVGDLVVKRKRPVDLGFLDFRTLEARIDACQREVVLNRRLGGDVYLGVADVVDDSDQVVDVAVVMRRLPDDQRLATRAVAGADLDDCVSEVARALATFHAAQPPADDAVAVAGPDALQANWDDNLAVLRRHPHLVDPARVDRLADAVADWLDGRHELVQDRIARGMVRDGHGDLTADDIFCTDDGPAILDCLDFTDRYRIGDVLLDVAFLAMDLERLGRVDLAARLLDTHAEFLDDPRPDGLAHHDIAYRASVRAKVACLGDDPSPGDLAPYLRIMERHLGLGRVRLVLVGGLPGTGKSTLAAGLGGRRGWSYLRSDEVRKDLLGIGHRDPAGPGGYTSQVTAATYAELLDRARALLAHGESVVLDASWNDPRHRAVAAAVAADTHAELVALRCTLPAEVAHQRLTERRGDVSDADTATHDSMQEHFAPWPEAIAIDTTTPRTEVLDRAAIALGLPPPHPATPPPPPEDPMDDRATDRQGLEVIAPESCLQLLDLSPVGRVAFVQAGEPVVLPVNHLRDGRSVVFRTASGITLDAAWRRATMAFEVDGYDQETRTGWSVLLRGRSDVETDDEAIERLQQADLHPWADEVDRPHWVRVRATEMSGRRIPDRGATQA